MFLELLSGAALAASQHPAMHVTNEGCRATAEMLQDTLETLTDHPPIDLRKVPPSARADVARHQAAVSGLVARMRPRVAALAPRFHPRPFAERGPEPMKAPANTFAESLAYADACIALPS